MQWSPALPMGMALKEEEGGEFDARGVGSVRQNVLETGGEGYERFVLTSWLIGAVQFFIR